MSSCLLLSPFDALFSICLLGLSRGHILLRPSVLPVSLRPVRAAQEERDITIILASIDHSNVLGLGAIVAGD